MEWLWVGGWMVNGWNGCGCVDGWLMDGMVVDRWME